MSPRSMEALRAGINSLSSNRRRALEVLRMATDDDPGMADAWLGRIAAGDRSLATLQELSNAAARLGQDLRNVGAFVEQLDVSFDVGYVRWRIDDTTSARLAYAAALIAEQHYERADAVLGELGRSHRVLYTRAQLLNDTERWTDLLSTVIGCEAWTEDQFLQRAASLLEGKAAANLGMFDRATAAVTRAAESSSPQGDPVVRDATYLRGLIARCQGEEDAARQLLADVAARWPDYQPARDALTDPTHSLHIIDQQTIDSRTAHWDPSTQTTPKQREADEQASDARQQLADAEATLAKMVGLDDVKKQVSTLKAMTAARILRQRKGIPTQAVSNHMLMVGPPGVGKTETARAVAKIFCGLGILAKPDIFEASREKLAGPYIGQIESQTRDFLDSALGATVFFDEFGELVHGGISGGDPVGQAIIGGLVPWMEDNRDKAVLIAAGYPRACERVLETNGGLRGRFATTIAFDSYPPDKLIAIAEAIIANNHSIVQPGVLQEILLAPFTRFYSQVEQTPDGDTVRTIDLLNNGRFVRNIIEAAQKTRDLRVISDLGVDDFDLNDESFGSEISVEKLSLLTRDDIYSGLQQALPPGLRTSAS
ncbi:type VII secretion AAA-ATPase EccA [[Mycobacterium] nativiensis]|nr:type VII secretion AAA-ATPase EccA [Mycolicibacter sp. MYC340]